MKTTMSVELSAKEVTELLVPAAKERVNAAESLGKMLSARLDDTGGLSVKVTFGFDTEAK
ncbi:MAG: hypothetical protein WC485_00175 [Opitutaceae bacterium]